MLACVAWWQRKIRPSFLSWVLAVWANNLCVWFHDVNKGKDGSLLLCCLESVFSSSKATGEWNVHQFLLYQEACKSSYKHQQLPSWDCQDSSVQLQCQLGHGFKLCTNAQYFITPWCFTQFSRGIKDFSLFVHGMSPVMEEPAL